MTPRQRWKIWCRQYRINRRETFKACTDAMLFGIGFVMYTDEPDFINHIPVGDIFL